jgi:hypothetical protein
VSLPVQATAAGLSGVTGDVSAAGVYIHADADWEVGSEIEFEITLPKKAIGAESDVRILCKGRVLRVDAHAKDAEGEHGVACVIDEYKFLRG